MLKKILVIVGTVLALFVVIFAVVVAFQPSEFVVTRTATMDAPPQKVFAQVNDFHRWEAWSPWTKLDPQAKNTFEGPSEGVGAKFSWSGNDEVGEGSMTITESKPHELVRLTLRFERPMQDEADTKFVFEPVGENQTKMTWTMSGENGFMEKAVCMFMNMDKVVGGSFDEGLANIKAIVEKPDEIGEVGTAKSEKD